MASKRAAHLQKGEAPPKTKMSSFKRAMLTNPPPESAAEVFRQSKPEVLKGKMAAVHDWLSTVAEDHEDAVRICVPRQSNRPPFGLAEPTNVLFSVQEFFGYVQAISDLHEPGFKEHTWEDIFSDPLDLADDPGTVHFRQHKWLLEPPIGVNLQGMVLKIRDAIASGEPYHRPPELVSDGDRRMNPQRLSPSPPAPMDEVVDMTYTEVHEPEDPPPEMPTRRDEGYSKNMLEDLIGQLTVITRELTSELVDCKDVPKLQNLVDEFFKSLERDGSPDWLVINTHLLSHFPDQLLMYGPIRGAWMYVFESFNGKIRRYAMVDSIYKVDLAAKEYILVKGKWFPEFNQATTKRFAKLNSKYGPDNTAKVVYTYDPDDPETPWDTTDPFILAAQIERQVVIKKHPVMKTAVVFDLKADFFECIDDDGSRPKGESSTGSGFWSWLLDYGSGFWFWTLNSGLWFWIMASGLWFWLNIFDANNFFNSGVRGPGTTCRAFSTKPGAVRRSQPHHKRLQPADLHGRWNAGTDRDSPPASPYSPTRPEPCDEANPTAGDSSLPDLRAPLSYSTSADGVNSADQMKFDDEPQTCRAFATTHARRRTYLDADPTAGDSSPPTSTGGGTGRDSPPASPSPTRPEPCDEADPTTSDSSPPTSAGGVDSDDPMEFHDEPQVAAHFPVDWDFLGIF
ncbi:hypothetical protein CYMTET_7448 [Cymbomonas tetramitiformis]|uniref:Uncharacterized protein n=1 Tax=Cymbomonas tetramitiformis TaxID=36881 RepID=A0AAE0GVM4_9CHLO|nr:hypothetical protein CYMTET_7448 [Cymbomonas tetramitiformis]